MTDEERPADAADAADGRSGSWRTGVRARLPPTRSAIAGGLAVGALLVAALTSAYFPERAAPPAQPSAGSAGGTAGVPSPGSTDIDAPAPFTPTSVGRTSATPNTTAPSGTRTGASNPGIAPAARFTNSCRYVLGDSSANPKTGSRFLAQSKIENTGNTGIEVDVIASWSQGDAERITEEKRVKVGWRESTTVRLSKPATQAEIDLIRKATGPEPNCRVEASIVATYGDLH